MPSWIHFNICFTHVFLITSLEYIPRSKISGSKDMHILKLDASWNYLFQVTMPTHSEWANLYYPSSSVLNIIFQNIFVNLISIKLHLIIGLICVFSSLQWFNSHTHFIDVGEWFAHTTDSVGGWEWTASQSKWTPRAVLFLLCNM